MEVKKVSIKVLTCGQKVILKIALQNINSENCNHYLE